jgi:NADPH2:quinone reductase
MRAVVIKEFGGPEMLRLTDVAEPVAGFGEVRISVHAAGTNPVDATNRADGEWAGLTTPCVLGYEVAGIIDQVGPGTSGLAEGDRVMAMLPFPGGAGGYAELAVAQHSQVAKIADNVSFAEAAATPVAAGTALEILARLALRPGDRLLILGAGGGVGQFLLQLATSQGLETYAVGRSANHERMYRLGATACIDYTTEDIVQSIATPVDAIADLIGDEHLDAKLPAVKDGGAIAAIEPPTVDLDTLIDRNLTFHGILLANNGDRTRHLAGLLEDGTLRPVISRQLPLDHASRAHEILEGRHSGGKIILRPS